PSPSPVPFTSPSGRQNRASPSPSVGTTGSPSPITQLTIAAITITPPRPTAGDPITFTADIHGPDPHTWSWTLQPINGPTQRTSDQPTLHDTITTPGTYTVTLHIKNDTQTAEHHQNFTVGAPPLTCGTTITVDTTLTTDLTCPTTALTIQGSSITLNLDGHTITGPGKTAAIAVSGDNNTITNGTITKYASAAKPDTTTPDLTLRSLKLRKSGAETDFVVSQPPGRARVTIEACDIDWDGAEISDSRHQVASMEMTDSTVRNAIVGLYGAMEFVLRGNTFEDSKLRGDQLSGAALTGNTFIRSPVTLGRDYTRPTEIADNTFTGAETALSISESSGLNITGNTFDDNGVGMKITDFWLTGRENVSHVQANHFHNNKVAGILVRSSLRQSYPLVLTITGNWLDHNGYAYAGTVDGQGKAVDDGIHIERLSTPPKPNEHAVLLAGNRTSGNADRGIEADSDSVDNGGDNTSSGDENGCYPETMCE
ncbi:right-handed parallel beta-helix repeat-containing protein, partial [Streptosporangiaceae bacterium NEAU-GS5]|nr:right-handed parallel beta-helix repeat-containing protein [Streptosporangiaceae bacterium NEAU-GS5]